MPSSTAAPLLSISTCEMSYLVPLRGTLLSVLPPTNNLSVFPQAHPERNCFTGIGIVIEMNEKILTLMSFAPFPDDLISPRYSSY